MSGLAPTTDVIWVSVQARVPQAWMDDPQQERLNNLIAKVTEACETEGAVVNEAHVE